MEIIKIKGKKHESNHFQYLLQYLDRRFFRNIHL